MLTSHLPAGPAALRAHSGFKGCTVNSTALMRKVRLYFSPTFGGFSGNPHGSANIRWRTLKEKFRLITNNK